MFALFFLLIAQKETNEPDLILMLSLQVVFNMRLHHILFSLYSFIGFLDKIYFLNKFFFVGVEHFECGRFCITCLKQLSYNLLNMKFFPCSFFPPWGWATLHLFPLG